MKISIHENSINKNKSLRIYFSNSTYDIFNSKHLMRFLCGPALEVLKDSLYSISYKLCNNKFCQYILNLWYTPRAWDVCQMVEDIEISYKTNKAVAVFSEKNGEFIFEGLKQYD